MRNLSKTKLLAFRQCPKRLWLEVHQPEVRQDSSATQRSFSLGHQVGTVAQQLYDPKGKGQTIDVKTEGFSGALDRTTELLRSSQPIFEATFTADGALALADVMLPTRKAGQRAWRMVEVKSSTKIEPYHRDDAAIQAFVAQSAGVPLASIALAHIDSSWVYPGGGDYQGLLIENDVTVEAFAREVEVKAWIAQAQTVVRKRTVPAMRTGAQCAKPYACGFLAHCQAQEPKTQYPVRWLPGTKSAALKSHIENNAATDMRDVPDAHLNERQQRVKKHTLSGKAYFDAKGAAVDLASHPLPAYFLDFETIQFTVPLWKGTRPFQQLPFQFSLHRLARTGKLAHQAFLDLSGKDPSKAFSQALVDACGERGPIFVYSKSFETGRIKELADRYPRLKQSLMAINARVVDLLPIAKNRYYHPSQQGSWSIKQVLPAIAPGLDYGTLEGVQNGGMAMQAYLTAIAPETSPADKTAIENQLLSYCKMDTYAMVKLWQFFTGRSDLTL